MSTDTDKCPKCGKQLIWIKSSPMHAYCPDGCYHTDRKDAGPEDVVPVMLHRIRELEHESRNARELHRAITEMTRRTDPALEQPDMTDLGQDVAFVVFVHWQMRRREKKLREALETIATAERPTMNDPIIAQEALKP